MRHDFRLADIGEGLEEAEIVGWRVQVGDVVSRDQPLIEVMTDKSNAELPAPVAGTVVELGGEVGDLISVGELIAVIDDGLGAGAEPPVATAARATVALDASVGEADQLAQPNRSASADQANFTARPKASPSTRREAARRGIDLGDVVGTGPGGRILVSDLDAGAPPPDRPASPDETSPAAIGPDTTPSELPASPKPSTTAPPAPRAGTRRPLRGIRRATAKNMTQSWSEIPHIHAFAHIDAQPLVSLRRSLRTAGNDQLALATPLAFFVAAVASALRAFPQANSSLDTESETIITHGDVNIGVAVAAPDGLVVPVLRGAQAIEFGDLSDRLNQLVVDARSGAVPSAAMAGGTATVTNFGSLGGAQATPLIRPPEAVILGFGSIASRPFVIDGDVVARETMHLVIGADHRLLDGDVTTQVLQHIEARLIEPLSLVLGS